MRYICVNRNENSQEFFFKLTVIDEYTRHGENMKWQYFVL